MRVLILPSWYPPYGGSFFVEQVQALQAVGLRDISVVYAEPYGIRNLFKDKIKLEYNIFLKEENTDFNIRTFRKRFPVAPRCELVNMFLQTRATLDIFREYVKKVGMPDIIHVHSAVWAGWAAYIIKKKYGIPYVVTEHRGRFTLKNPSTKKLIKLWYSPFIKKILDSSNHIILVGNHIWNGYQRYLKRDEDKISIIPNGVNTDRFTLEAQRQKRPFTFISVGGLNRLKGFDILLKAFKLLLVKTDRFFRLNIIGDGPEKENLLRLTTSLGLDNNVIFHGQQSREEVAHFLRKADVFVLATKLEAQPVCFIEAMSCGLPIIATSAVPEEACPEFAGIRVSVNSKEEIANAMQSIYSNYRSYDHAKIRDFAITEFDFPTIAKKILNVYSKSINDSSNSVR